MTPPRLLKYLLRFFTGNSRHDSYIGDVEELYNEIRTIKGAVFAWIWYSLHVLKVIPVFLCKSIHWSFIMFKNYLKIAIRNIIKQKVFTVINLAGLSAGLTCSIFIVLYIQFELSYDSYHENADNIYRIVMHQKGNVYQGTDMFNITSASLREALLNNYPEVKKVTRVKRVAGLIANSKNVFNEDRILFADTDFFEIFTYRFLEGDEKTAIDAPFNVVITRNTAKKYFGNNEPIGKTLSLNNEHDIRITGVIENVPENSHFKFDFLTSFQTYIALMGGVDRVESWKRNLNQTYILLPEGYNSSILEKKLPALLKANKPGDTNTTFLLQPLRKIHLGGTYNFEIEPNSDKRYIYLFSTIAFIIILTACFNYMNLTTACTSNRSKEVGMRKVIGAPRRSLIYQFIGESVIFSFAALLIAVILVNIFMPEFRNLIERNLSFNIVNNINLISGLVIIALFTGVISGVYPALFLSALKPISIIKGNLSKGSKQAAGFRNILVILQFVITIILVISCIVIFNQLNFIKNKNLGFDKENILVIRLGNKNLQQNYEPFKNELLKNPRILKISASVQLPTTIRTNNGSGWEGRSEGESMDVYEGVIDYNFLDVYGIKLINGRNFSKDIPTDNNAYIINETLAETVGWDDPVGKKFGFFTELGTVIGMVEDFHYYPLHLQIEPLAFRLINVNSSRSRPRYFSIKTNFENLENVLSFIEDKYKKFSPDSPFEYFLFDERVDMMYKNERKSGQLINCFTILAVLIACLGMFGLASYNAEQKTKEIGIRKVFGSKNSDIVRFLIRDYIKCIIYANLIACPIAWYAASKWLQNFAYKSAPEWWIFILSGFFVLLLVVVSISFQITKAARTNPVDLLRCE